MQLEGGGGSATTTSGSDASWCLSATCHLKKVGSKRGCCTGVQAGSGQGDARARRRASWNGLSQDDVLQRLDTSSSSS